ncbi:MAG: hypothetical protein K2P12_03265 [Clostridia bacterium]|nr:hypothetical protein [Clostridia bacterium]
MRVGILLGITAGAVATYACMSDNKIEKTMKKLAKKMKSKYKEMMD